MTDAELAVALEIAARLSRQGCPACSRYMHALVREVRRLRSHLPPELQYPSSGDGDDAASDEPLQGTRGTLPGTDTL